MKNYTLEELRKNLDVILRDVVVADDFAMIEVDKNLKAVIISEADWEMMRGAFAMLIGGTTIKK